MNEIIFRKKSLERIAAPDELDDYLKVTSPSVWVILAALILAVTAAGVWCFFASIPTTAPAVGIRSQAGAVCFLSAGEGYSISPGMKVQIRCGNSEDTLIGTVAEVGEPVQADSAAANAGADWLVERMPGSWVCPVMIQVDNENIPANAECLMHIILNERRPINLLLGR
ncbi:hypothetical protein DW886_23760 [Enterocloster aldenensis]|uniref:hypothetical protein n=1 Tax=Enterocloster aldenensis TaxID=358742 RepID=UPI000E4E32F5|nr:hypothetical protein DW886_23760 [Enterocloster aldenensis]